MSESPLFARYVPRLVLERPAGAQAFSVEGSMVFADVSGFTKLSERLAEQGKAGAEELTAILNDRFTDLLTESFAEGGDLLKYGGDALLLLFRGPGHADRACRAAFRMRAALRERGAIATGRGKVVLKVSQGVHSGEFQCFLAGDHQRELILAGHEASQVTAMETVAEAGDVLMSPATAALLDPRCCGAAKGPGILLRRAPAAVPVPEPAPPSPLGEPAERFVPTPVRGRVLAGVEESEHRYATIGFLHVFGLDDLVASVPPEDVLGRLDRLVRVTETAAAEAGLCLISSDIAEDGTKLILTAGAPDAVEDGEGRMLSVVRAILDQVDDLGLHAGVNAGHIFAGDVGAPFRRVYTVIGDAVNLAARLMSKAGHGQVLAHRPTLERAGVSFEAQPLEPFMVKGKSKPIEALAVGARLGTKERVRSHASPFTGRAAERAILAAVLDGARQGRGGCVTVVGAPGIGKSRLVESFLAEHPGLVVTRVTCEPLLAERPYFIARLVLRRVLGIDLGAGPAEAGAQLTAAISKRAPQQLPYLPLLALVVDAEVPSTPTVDQITPANRSRVLAEITVDVMSTFVDDLSVLVVEEAEWMDAASTAVLARFLQVVNNRPWFVCITTRGGPGGLPNAPGIPTQRVELGPLDEESVRALASQLVGEAAVPAHDIELLCSRSAGNPLFLLELITARLSAGSVAEVPSSLEDLVTSRIDLLDPSDRRALRYFSVLGDRFSSQLVNEAFGETLPGLDDPTLWDRLGEFLVAERRGDRRFAFDLVRQVAYGGLPYRRRRELHERVGLALEQSGSVVGGDRVSLLSLHFDQAHDHARAWRYSREAGTQALEKYANLEAATFLERAIHHGRIEQTATPEELAQVAEQLGDASSVVGRYDSASWGYELARSLRSDDVESLPRLLRKEGIIRERSGRYRAALGWYRRAMRHADQLSPVQRAFEDAELAVAYAGVRLRQGHLRDSVRWCRQALELAAQGHNRRATAHAYYLLDAALTDLGDPQGAQVRELALPIFEELGDLHGQANVLNNLGVDALYEGKWEEAARWWERCRDVRQRGGDVVGLADVSHNLGEMRSDQGRFEEAEALMRQGRRIWRAAQYPLGVAAATNGLGRLAVRAGRFDDGIAMLRESLESFRALQASMWVWEVEIRLSEGLAYAGRTAEALEQVEHALREYDLPTNPPLYAMALRVRGVVRDDLGERDGGMDDLGRAIEVAAQGSAPFEEAIARFERARRTADPAVRALDEERSTALCAQLGIEPAAVCSPTLPAWHK